MKKIFLLLFITHLCFAGSKSYSRSYTRNVNVTKVYHGGGYGHYGYGYHPLDHMVHTMATVAMVHAMTQPRQQDVQVIHDNQQPQIQYINQAPCVNCTVRYDNNGNMERVN